MTRSRLILGAAVVIVLVIIGYTGYRSFLAPSSSTPTTRMETRLPWRPTRGSLTSPSYLVRDRTLGPPLENNPEIPPSSTAEGLRLLHGLETNLATSLQTPQEA